jgi:TfoX/Sxy family transcriptional regulator of competence genes
MGDRGDNAMPPDETLVNRVRTALGQNRRVEEKKMFGGIAFMVEGKMCVTVGQGRIMCRIDPANHDMALGRKGCTTVLMKGREYRGYVRIAADALGTKRDLDYWVRLALDFNNRAKASTRKRH